MSRVLQPHDLFALERSQWADIHRHHYAFGGNGAFDFSAADLMQHGQYPPLLNNDETGFLNQFFDTQADPFTDPGLLDAEFQRNSVGNFGWVVDEPAPTLQQISGITSPAHTFRPNHVPPQPAYTSAQSNSVPVSAVENVFNTTPVLLHHSGPQQNIQRPSHMPISQAPTTPAVPSAVSSTYLPSAPQPTASPPTIRQRRQSTATSPRLVFGLQPYSETTGEILTPNAGANFDETAHAGIPPQRQAQTPRRSVSVHARTHSESFLQVSRRHSSESAVIEPNPRLYRFGSDSHFGVDGYVREQNEPSAEQVQQTIMDNNFGAIGGGFLSASPTRAPSPVVGERRRFKQEPGSDDSDEPQRKRRRNTVAQIMPSRQTAAASPPSPLPIRRRRASPQTSTNGTPARRQPRENLTEEQKRNNHIASEQKRRNYIKEGFEKLGTIVPALQGTGLSKSNVLVEGVQYLEDLVAKNEQLKAILGL